MASSVRIIARALPLAVAIATAPAVAQDYPSRPVTIVVGYTPGATSDLLARTMAERLNAAWGQSVIVDNRSGVGGNIAAGYVARAPADGYTLMVGTDAIMTSNVFLYKNTPFDPVKDFAPITNAGANIICLAVHVDLPVNSVAELIAYAKANPGKLQYGSSGIGSPHHLAGELLRQKTGIEIVHVPYRGSAPALQDLLAGNVQMSIDTIVVQMPHIQSGGVRGLAVATIDRNPTLPDLPPIADTLPGFDLALINYINGPAGLPLQIVEKLNREINAVLADPDIRKRMEVAGFTPIIESPQALERRIRQEQEKWKKVIALIK